MTREEAIVLLKDEANYKKDYPYDRQAFEMAIKALEQERNEWIEMLTKENERLHMMLEQKPCEDAISREAVDKYIARLLSGYLYDGERERLEIFSAYLWELPSVTPKPTECEDAISRREALKCLNGAWGDYSVLNEVFERIDKLPSVTPSRPKGRWIKAKPWMLDNTSYKWECSECEKSERFRHNFCPNCGAEMVEPQESEV